MKNTKNKILKIFAGLIAIILIGGILFITNAFLGNPISARIADETIKQYIKENYSYLDLELEKPIYNFKDGSYVVNARSKSSIDTKFGIHYRNGSIGYDSYEMRVLGMFNTLDRLSDEYSAVAKRIIDKELEYEIKNTRVIYDKSIYENRVFDSQGVADPSVEIKFGPNIKDWPKMYALPQNLVLKVVSEIHDPVTTTDELIPSGETSSYRSNPLGLAEFTLSRKDPAYVGRAKEVQTAQKAIEENTCPLDVLEELKPVMAKVRESYPEAGEGNLGVGSTIFAVKPGDGSAREQAASCQKVLGGWANIANGYATKRYRSNLINWGMLPFLTDADHENLPFKNGDYIFVPDVRKAVEDKADVIKAYVVGDSLEEIEFRLGELTDAEREIILKGCLINYYRD